jgi:hypothetical protein
MSLEKAQRYHRIAQSCLKALNAYTQTGQDPKQAVQAAYDAIEAAFEHENQLLMAELRKAKEALSLIAQAPDSVTREQMQTMAHTVLTPTGH